MVLLNEAIEWIRDEVIGNVTKGQLGTGNTLSTPEDTGLETPDASTIEDLSYTVSGNQVTFSFIKDNETGVGTTYREYGIYDNTNSVYWTRFVFTELESTDFEDWNIKIRMFFRSV